MIKAAVIFSVLIVASKGQIFRPPNLRACVNRRAHFEAFGKRYHFSWLGAGPNTRFDWVRARNYCRRFCMDAVAFDSSDEYEAIKIAIDQARVPHVWTSGRKCNFSGCGRVDLQPAIINGWFWASTGQRIEPKNSCQVCDWSGTGGLGQPQPDNREFRVNFDGEEEACVAILNNFYGDGIRWHDVACSHEKHVVCQEDQRLLRQVGL